MVFYSILFFTEFSLKHPKATKYNDKSSNKACHMYWMRLDSSVAEIISECKDMCKLNQEEAWVQPLSKVVITTSGISSPVSTNHIDSFIVSTNVQSNCFKFVFDILINPLRGLGMKKNSRSRQNWYSSAIIILTMQLMILMKSIRILV